MIAIVFMTAMGWDIPLMLKCYLATVAVSAVLVGAALAEDHPWFTPEVVYYTAGDTAAYIFDSNEDSVSLDCWSVLVNHETDLPPQARIKIDASVIGESGILKSSDSSYEVKDGREMVALSFSGHRQDWWKMLRDYSNGHVLTVQTNTLGGTVLEAPYSRNYKFMINQFAGACN